MGDPDSEIEGCRAGQIGRQEWATQGLLGGNIYLAFGKLEAGCPIKCILVTKSYIISLVMSVPVGNTLFLWLHLLWAILFLKLNLFLNFILVLFFNSVY